MTSAKAKGLRVVRVESVIPRRNVLQEVAGLLAIVLQGLANAACVRILFRVIIQGVKSLLGITSFF